MLKSFFLSSLYQEPDLAWASSQETFPGHSGLAKMTDSQRLRVSVLGTDPTGLGFRTAPQVELPLSCPQMCLSKEGFEEDDSRISFHS